MVMNMQIALKQGNMGALQSKLQDISNPKSPNYGKWLSKEELEGFTRPSEESVKMVKLWLSSYDIHERDITQTTPDWLEVKVPLSKAEGMLDSKFSLYHDSVSGKSAPRTTEYSIPLLLHDHIDTIQPTTAFHRAMGPQVAQNQSDTAMHKRQSGCDPNNIVPSCIQSHYNVDYSGKGRASLAVTGFIGLSASHSDAASFLSSYDSAASGSDFKDGSIGGASNVPSNPDLEGNLDTQIALSIGHPNPVTYYAVGPNNDPDNQFTDELINFGTYLNSASNPPTAVSTSYGGEEQFFSHSYLDRICNEFMKAGSRGISVFFSSGDFGVGGNGESNCNDGFYSLFPASCPYITSVGATQFSNGAEIAATFERGGSTGGGFSWYFPAPSYQSADTKKYISNNLDNSYSGYYNPSGRGFPDVALVGEYYDIILNGGTQRVYGTSASSPAWASLISLINDYRIGEGKSTLGFLNPLLYQNAGVRAALNDITQGHNQGCGTYGFPASAGWDPTTGLGTMNFAKLRKALG
ncbi:Tripeptidyl-peptidase I [Purpureocillium takamizusanense]|uniref:tripeptidyl-peptidase II n=1 Tax=Purpureocillium takamizusanense TaxID=2060973 RepID=A0A9Q8QR31_9HYPO|nr:Tripeptidyl-peptidase I [Purpureocillium takamizusanense]UNI22942.1 Tripeptidyl-peptidase I [Purpureocillium takamizusanense]